jgi:thioredoxin reductase
VILEAWHGRKVAALLATSAGPVQEGATHVHGAAVSEARALRGRPVCVVGAGNAAGQAALHLAKYA